ncbi:MAG: GNAT family N-acetyltransferase [Acidimicrobiales bacterium]
MIRRLEREDRHAWQLLWEGYLHFYRGSVSSQDTDSTFARLCDQSSGLMGLVAVDDDGSVVGLAHLVFHPSTWSSADYCYLEDLFVQPSSRGSGAAGELIEAVYATADESGCARVYWETQEFNGPARSLYDTVAHRTSFVIYER